MAKRKASTLAANVEEQESPVEVAELPSAPPIPSEPVGPITDSYTWASAVPIECSKEDKDSGSGKVPCVLGVDEAGRGPVLGPLVYGIAYCPLAYHDAELKEIGFADSKALTAERRDTLLGSLISEGDHLGWAVRVMSPQDISAGMLRRRPVNLNAQSSQATVELIAGVLAAGVDVTEIYVDTVGDPKTYSRLLSSYFPRHPHIKWTVTSKADAIYPIVGAASIAAKVTRDRCIENWAYAEAAPGKDVWKSLGALGSGYPGDPNTVAYLKRTLDPVFGWPGIVRFSWATAKTMMEDKLKMPSTSTVVPLKANGTTTRSLSRSNSVVIEPEAPVAPMTSLFGTLLPVAKPGSTVTRAYKAKWTDEPVAISKFFGAVKPKPDPNPSTTTAEDDPFRLSEAQQALNACMLQEPQWRAKASPTSHTNIGKLQKDLGLLSCAAAFVQ